MGKHEPMTAKAIANKIKAKGLQKIKYYCEMCKKQCRDDNGFKCHIQSESHQRQALIVCENPEKFVGEFSQQFMDGFMYILKTRYRTKRVLANTVFQEYIKERDHVHMNSTRWTSLTEFAHWAGEQNMVKVDESERGVLVTYIDRDPETLRRQELDAKRVQQAKEAADKTQKEIERQMEATKKIYEEIERRKPKPEAKPIEIVNLEPSGSSDILSRSDDVKDCGASSNNSEETTSDNRLVSTSTSSSKIDSKVKPIFKVAPITIKPTTSMVFKPPPPKRKITKSNTDINKKAKYA